MNGQHVPTTAHILAELARVTRAECPVNSDFGAPGLVFEIIWDMFNVIYPVCMIQRQSMLQK